jgi:hypothetical protein
VDTSLNGDVEDPRKDAASPRSIGGIRGDKVVQWHHLIVQDVATGRDIVKVVRGDNLFRTKRIAGKDIRAAKAGSPALLVKHNDDTNEVVYVGRIQGKDEADANGLAITILPVRVLPVAPWVMLLSGYRLYAVPDKAPEPVVSRFLSSFAARKTRGTVMAGGPAGVLLRRCERVPRRRVLPRPVDSTVADSIG